jgi:hypothetical protein
VVRIAIIFRRGRGLRGAFCVAARLALAQSAISFGAHADVERFRFEYRAPSECPDARSFVERVAARTDRARLAANDDANAATMTVDITVRELEASGRLEFADVNGESVVRTVGGKTCDEIVSGLALIAALAIEARTSPATPPETTALPATPAPRDMPADTSSASASPLRFGAGLSGGVDSSSSPGAAPVAGIYGELAWRAPFRFVRLGARGASRAGSVGARTAVFTRWSGRLEACPVSVPLASHLGLPACLAFELGQLSAAGRASAALPETESAQILWAASEASAGFRWEPDRIWILEARGGLEFPWVRHSFVFHGPFEPIFDVPPISWTLAIDVGAHFR